MPKVSVIIPTYNRVNYICEAIDSVLNQSFKDYEIIVIDDGSLDNTKKVLAKYDGKIRYFYQKNEGISSARNKGIKEAKGEYIAFLDSDDFWMKEKLEIQADILDRSSDIALTYCYAKRIDTNNRELDIKPSIPAIKAADFLRDARIPMTVMFRKNCLSDVGLFDERIKVGEDTDMWLRFSIKNKINFLEKRLAVIRTHDSNISDNYEEMYLGKIKIIQKLLSNEIQNDFSRNELRDLLAKSYYNLSRVYYRETKDFESSAKFTIKAIIFNPFVGKSFIAKNDPYCIKLKKMFNPYLLLLVNFSKMLFHTKKQNKPFKILFYEPSSGFGGSAKELSYLVNNIDRQKFNPVVVINNFGPQIGKINCAKIIKLRHYTEPLKLTKFIFLIFIIRNILPETIKIYFILKRNSISLVYINTNIISGVPAILASKVAKIPIICCIKQSKKLIRREKMFSKFVNKFIILSNAAYEIYKQDIPQQKLEIIYNCINLNNFAFCKKSFKEEFDLKSNPVIGLVGRIVKGKGQREFILSAKEVLKVKPKAIFAIIGDAKGDSDAYYKEVRELVKRENLTESIIFTGWRNDVEDIINDIEILIQASTTFPEGLSNTILEAMALRKPVIATNVAGQQEVIIDGVTGLLVPPGDIEAMAEKIIYLLDNPQIAKEMGQRGRQRVEEFFDIRKTVTRIEEIYNSLVI